MRWLFFFLVFLMPFQISAEELQSPTKQFRKAENRWHSSSEDCSTGSALDQSFCIRERLDELEKVLDLAMEAALAMTSNTWGHDATREQKKNMKEAHRAWKTYRHEHCWFAYVSNQKVNTSSQQARNLSCEIDKTLARIIEIKSDYLGPQ